MRAWVREKIAAVTDASTTPTSQPAGGDDLSDIPPPATPRSSGRSAATKDRPAPGAAPLGMAIFLASLAVLFVASLIGYAYVRVLAREAGNAWPPAGMPALPGGLWLSTAVLLISSLTVHGALRAAGRGDARRTRDLLVATLVLGAAFLVSQVVAWWHLITLDMPASKNLYAFTFWMLTGLHGLHVIGGLGPLAVTTWRSTRGRYSKEDHTGVLLVAMYWHFLDCVWLVIFAVLYLFGGR